MQNKLSNLFNSKQNILIFILVLITIFQIYQIEILTSKVNNLQWHYEDLEYKIGAMQQDIDSSQIGSIDFQLSDFEDRISTLENSEATNYFSISDLESKVSSLEFDVSMLNLRRY